MPSRTGRAHLLDRKVTAFAVLLAVAASCAPRGPLVGATKTPTTSGTIAGLVRALGTDTPLVARMVTATNIATGETHQVSTAVNGGYTIKVPLGRYRLKVELRPGESLSERPDDLEITASDVDAQRNFVIAVQPARTSLP